jgi:hypothetical protein
MPSEKKAPFGGVVTVKVKKKGKVRKAAPKSDRRYGPPPFSPENPNLSPLPQVTVHDVTQIFAEVKYRERVSNIALEGGDWFNAYIVSFDEGAGDIFRWTEMLYNRAQIGFIKRGGTDPRDEIEWTEVISQSLLRGQNFNDGGGDTRPDPDHVPNRPIYIFDEVDVFNIDAAETQTNYRKNDKCWPIEKAASKLGLKLRVGVRQVDIGGSGWQAKPQKAENKAAETVSLDMPIPTGTNAWARGKREAYSLPGAFRSPLDTAKYPIKIESTGHFYESFDSADTTNYKVTSEPNYSADEVPGRFLIGTKRVKVFVVPQIWGFEYNNPGPVIDGGAAQTFEPCTLYDFARTLPVAKWYRYKQNVASPPQGDRHAHRDNLASYNAAFGTSFPSSWHFYQEELDYLTLPIAVSDYPYITNNADQIALIASNQRSKSMTDARSIVHYETPYGERSIARGNLTVKNTQTVAGRLVGAVQVSEDSKFYIWRKTDTERTILNLYSGKTTPIDTLSFDGSTSSGIWIYDAADTVPGQPTDIPSLEQYFNFTGWAFVDSTSRIPPEDW